MIAQWMMYAVLLGLAVSALTLAAEYALRLYGRSARWLWATSLGAALALPLAAWLLTAPPAPLALGALGQPLPLAMLPAAASAAPVAPVRVPVWRRLSALEARIDRELPWLWLGSSVLAALALALSYARLRRQRGRWSEAEVDGMPVLVSGGTGPAVVGLRRARIVLPAWVLEEPEARRRMILAHEAEHLAAGDARLLTGALAALVAAPWNPLLWWQIRRLRLAAELDCDARVLRRGADLRGYAGLLLDVGMRFGEGGALAAFAEPRSLLARRLRALTAPRPRRRGWRAAAVTAAAAGVAALACVAPRPDKPLPTEPLGPPQPQVAAAPAETGEWQPPYTPYTAAPELSNRDEARRVILQFYPPTLRSAGVGGVAQIWVHVDANGRVAESRVARPSGQPPLDSAALRVARTMLFKPARNGLAATDIWIQLPIVFMPKGGSEIVSAEDSAIARRIGILAPPGVQRNEMPPGVRAPELSNGSQMAALIRSSYPPLLRAAGVGGTAWLRLEIDARGAVVAAPVVGSSGRAELDSAAVKVARGMRFTPAVDTTTGKPLAVQVTLPIRFRPTTAAAAGAPGPGASAPAPPNDAAAPAPNAAAAPARNAAAAPVPSAAAPAVQDTFDVAPRLLNMAQVNAAVSPTQWASVHAADVVLGVRVDEGGNVTDVRVRHSVSPVADSLALAAVRLMRFAPALRQGRPVAAWIEAARQPRARPTAEQLRQGPVFTPFQVAPGLTNRDEVRLALVREFPPDLKAAGVRDTASIWMLLDQNGTPLQVRVRRPSHYATLDSAAVRVGQMMRFTPALDQGKPVEVWIALPVIFAARPDGAAPGGQANAGKRPNVAALVAPLAASVVVHR